MRDSPADGHLDFLDCQVVGDAQGSRHEAGGLAGEGGEREEGGRGGILNYY